MSIFMAIHKPEAETSCVVAETSSVVAESSSVVADYPRQLGKAEVQRRARLANMLIACQNLMARTE